MNLRQRPKLHWRVHVRHRDMVGVLASILTEIRKANVNVAELENLVFTGAQAACAKIPLGTEPTEELLATIGSLPNILGVSVHEP